MESITNDQIIVQSSKMLGHQVEHKPDLNTSQIQLVADVNPAHNRFCDIARAGSAVNSASTTVYTTPTDRDFYLTSLCLTVIKDATATSTSTRINATIGGATQVIARIDGLTLTVQNQTITEAFVFPIKVDPGTNITVTNITATANVTGAACIQGFTTDKNL